jgi:hypothetical protein
MSNEEANSLYKFTVCEYHVLYKWDAGGTPSQPMELQVMTVDGQVNRETGGSDVDRISVGADADMSGESTSGVTPTSHICHPRKTVVTFRS